MKKIIAVVIVLVLAIGIFTVSSIAADGKINECEIDEKVTLLLPADGAQIIDTANGADAVVTHVTQDQMTLTAVEDFDAEKTKIYDELMATSDLRDICDNIEMSVTSIEPGADVREFYMWDTFDIKLTDEASAALKESEERYLELTLECDVTEDEPVAIMVYTDGKWVAVDEERYDVEDGDIVLRLNQEGMVTILRKRDGSVSSNVVRPSVEIKPVPEPIHEKDKNTFPLWDDESDIEVVCEIPDEDLVLTCAASLEGDYRVAYLDLAETESISALCPNFMDTAKKIDPSVEEEQLIIRDVFELKLIGGSEQCLDAENDNNVVFNFKYQIDEGAFFMVLEYFDGKWIALDPDCCAALDNQVEVRLFDDGLLAFIVKEQ